jgi:hypothetical protein
VLPKGRMRGVTDETGLIGNVTSAHRERRQGECTEQTGHMASLATQTVRPVGLWS